MDGHILRNELLRISTEVKKLLAELDDVVDHRDFYMGKISLLKMQIDKAQEAGFKRFSKDK